MNLALCTDYHFDAVFAIVLSFYASLPLAIIAYNSILVCDFFGKVRNVRQRLLVLEYSVRSRAE